MVEQKQSLRKSYSRRYDILLLIVLSGVLLIAGLSLPILTVEKTFLFWKEGNTFSILSGLKSFVLEGHYLLAAIIFFFSVVFPIAKLFALLTVWIAELNERQRSVMLHWLDALGKWSMLDVFIVAVTVVAVKLGSLASARPRPGIYVFALAILLSMLATLQINGLARKS